MEHEESYHMMMEALDGELDAARQQALTTHLRACAYCQREWQALLAVDQLLRDAPILTPAAGFTQRALARLPNRRYRIWFIGAIYVVLLFSGALPLLAGAWAAQRYASLVGEPGVLRSLLQALRHTVEVIGTVAAALVTAAGQFVLENPTTLGWFFVMMGVVAVWGGVYRQLLSMPQLSPTRSTSN